MAVERKPGGTDDATPSPGAPAGHGERGVLRFLRLLVLGDSELRRSVYILLVLAILYTLYLAQGVLLPVFLSVFLSILLHPIVGLLTRLRVPHSLGAGIVVVALVAALGLGVYQLSTPAVEWLDRGSLLPEQITLKLEALRESIERARETTEALRQLTAIGDDGAALVVVDGPSLTEQVLGQARDTIFTLSIVVVMVFFLLAKGADTLNQVQASFIDAASRERWSRLMVDIRREISRYLLTITIINIVLGGCVSLAMWMIGMPSPLLWGAIAGIMNFMPYVGPTVTTLIIGTASMLTFGGWLTILLPPAAYLSLAILEGNFITPLIIGHRLTLNPITVFIFFLFWGWAWGVPGVLMAVPILAVLKITFSHIPQLKRYRVLLG
ncbi:MAG: AI-2E family transporter [Rhodospirillaceae bacterium]|nr:AI-2E family transporter [Rhodospirillaceae bacterium]